MGIYAITGASSGIGATAAQILREQGNQVINIDVKDGDITVNLATPEGRQYAVDKLHEMCPALTELYAMQAFQEHAVTLSLWCPLIISEQFVWQRVCLTFLRRRREAVLLRRLIPFLLMR